MNTAAIPLAIPPAKRSPTPSTAALETLLPVLVVSQEAAQKATGAEFFTNAPQKGSRLKCRGPRVQEVT